MINCFGRRPTGKTMNSSDRHRLGPPWQGNFLGESAVKTAVKTADLE